MTQLTLADSPRIENDMALALQSMADQLIAERDAALKAGAPPMDLPTWYLGEQAKIDALIERATEQRDVIVKYLESRRAALQWRWGVEFQQDVDLALRQQGGTKKSVDYLTGRAGYRKAPGRVQITDKDALRTWCEEHCTDALDLTIARTTPLKEHIEQTGEVPPGAEWIGPRDTFYPRVEQKQIEGKST
jgi:hypothetical protein